MMMMLFPVLLPLPVLSDYVVIYFKFVVVVVGVGVALFYKIVQIEKCLLLI